MLKVLLAISTAILLTVTNPSKQEFIVYANIQLKKLFPDITSVIKKDDDIFVSAGKIAGNVIANAALDQATVRDNFVVFSLFTIDTSYLRVISIEVPRIKYVGVLGMFFRVD